MRGPGGAHTQLVGELRVGDASHFATLEALGATLAAQGGDPRDRLHRAGAAAVLRSELERARTDAGVATVPALAAGDQ